MMGTIVKRLQSYIKSLYLPLHNPAFPININRNGIKPQSERPFPSKYRKYRKRLLPSIHIGLILKWRPINENTSAFRS